MLILTAFTAYTVAVADLYQIIATKLRFGQDSVRKKNIEKLAECTGYLF